MFIRLEIKQCLSLAVAVSEAKISSSVHVFVFPLSLGFPIDSFLESEPCNSFSCNAHYYTGAW